MSSSPTPAQLGFRMPAEWEPHAGTWLTWPRPDGISFPDRYFNVPPVYAKFIQQLVEVEEVKINIWDAEMEAWFRALLAHNKVAPDPARFNQFPAFAPWCGKHGPVLHGRQNNGV